MITLYSIQIFIRVAREGSFSAAGRSMNLSPASIARHIASLEQSIDVPLIHRNSRTLRLTEAGHLYLERVRPLVAGLQDAQDSITGFNVEAKGSLRVHCRTTIGTLIVAPALPLFLASHPDMEITLLLSNDTSVDLIGDNIDVDIQVGRQADSSYKARLLARDRSVLCAAPAYLTRAAPIRHPDDLRMHNCLTYHYSDSNSPPTWRFMDREGEPVAVPVRGNIRTNNGVALQAALRSGVGVAVVPEWAIRPDISAGDLIELLPEYRVHQNEAGTSIYAVFPASRLETVKTRMFIDFLVKLFR